MTKLVVAKRDGIEEIHKPGCADLKKAGKRGWSSYRPDYVINAETLADVYRDYWECIDEENVDEGQYATVEEVWWAWRSEFRLMPCVGNVPEMDDPTGESPAPANGAKGNRAGNQELARWLVDLVAANSGDLDEAGQQKVANWLKALPTGGAGK